MTLDAARYPSELDFLEVFGADLELDRDSMTFKASLFSESGACLKLSFGASDARFGLSLTVSGVDRFRLYTEQVESVSIDKAAASLRVQFCTEMFRQVITVNTVPDLFVDFASLSM